jgi:hypothetical protein
LDGAVGPGVDVLGVVFMAGTGHVELKSLVTFAKMADELPGVEVVGERLVPGKKAIGSRSHRVAEVERMVRVENFGGGKIISGKNRIGSEIGAVISEIFGTSEVEAAVPNMADIPRRRWAGRVEWSRRARWGSVA